MEGDFQGVKVMVNDDRETIRLTAKYRCLKPVVTLSPLLTGLMHC